jgi:class 3 adenylate cyclase
MDDIRAVMDAVGSDRAALMGLYEGGALAALFAATYPERVAALVLFHATPRFVANAELPWLRTRTEYERDGEEMMRRWGDREWFANEYFGRIFPSATREELQGWARMYRRAVSPGSMAAYWKMSRDFDVCGALGSISAPTLVMTRTDNVFRADVRTARYLAEHIHGARLAELPGSDFGPHMGDSSRVMDELSLFFDDVLEKRSWEAEPNRVLATVLFTDIVGATARAAELGDRAWNELLGAHHATVRSQLEQFRGVEMDTAGDGFFATFDGPARGVRCACAIRDSLKELGLEVRAGLHCGECEIVDGKTSGIAVHIGARVASLATPGEVLVSSTVKDLVAGSGIEFKDRGEQQLKGISEAWRLFRVVR